MKDRASCVEYGSRCGFPSWNRHDGAVRSNQLVSSAEADQGLSRKISQVLSILDL